MGPWRQFQLRLGAPGLEILPTLLALLLHSIWSNRSQRKLTAVFVACFSSSLRRWRASMACIWPTNWSTVKWRVSSRTTRARRGPCCLRPPLTWLGTTSTASWWAPAADQTSSFIRNELRTIHHSSNLLTLISCTGNPQLWQVSRLSAQMAF